MALPGLGHFYLRRRRLAILELAIGLILFALAIGSLGLVFLRVLDERASPLDLLRVCLPWGLVLVAYSLLDGLFTWLVSRRRVVLSPPSRGDS